MSVKVCKAIFGGKMEFPCEKSKEDEHMAMNVFGANSGNVYELFKNDIRKTENKTTGKTEKTEGLRRSLVTDITRTTTENSVSKANEEKLSARAQEYLEKLREEFGDYDFMVGNSSDNLSEMVNSSNKEFSVIFSTEEIEKMAADEDYAKEKLAIIDEVVAMSERINDQYGFESALDAAQGGGNTLSKFGVAIGDDGKVTLFAELEKSSDKQKERLDASEDAGKAAEKLSTYSKPDENSVKKMTIQAGSEEELLEKLAGLDWKEVPAETSAPGARLNFTV